MLISVLDTKVKVWQITQANCHTVEVETIPYVNSQSPSEIKACSPGKTEKKDGDINTNALRYFCHIGTAAYILILLSLCSPFSWLMHLLVPLDSFLLAVACLFWQAY